jgi:hypothetical protein
MKSLLYLNIFTIIFLTACSPVKKSQLASCPKGSYKVPSWKSPFLVTFEKALFHTTLDIKGNHLSGITIIKRTSDTSFHFTFANEIGITYLDLDILKDTFHPLYIFEPMNKKSFLKILAYDLKLLLFSDSNYGNPEKFIQKSTGKEVFSYPGMNLFVWPDSETGRITKLAGWTTPFDAAIIGFNPVSDTFPSHIIISNPRIKLSLEMNLLGR